MDEQELRKLRKRCEARLRDLDVPVPFDLDAFCTSVAARRGRAIVLCSVAGRHGPSGAWIASGSIDYIFYAAQTNPLHQQHIALHEVSHLLCDHPSSWIG